MVEEEDESSLSRYLESYNHVLPNYLIAGRRWVRVPDQEEVGLIRDDIIIQNRTQFLLSLVYTQSKVDNRFQGI